MVNKEERYRSVGRTSGGRVLSVVWTIRYGKVPAITAFPSGVADRKAFLETPAPVVALRIPEADLALARKQAEQKGLPYQTYIKSLLHETLAEREKRKVGW